MLIWLSFLCILLEDPQIIIYLTPATRNVKRHLLTLTWAEFIPVLKVCRQNLFSSWYVHIIDHQLSYSAIGSILMSMIFAVTVYYAT